MSHSPDGPRLGPRNVAENEKAQLQLTAVMSHDQGKGGMKERRSRFRAIFDTLGYIPPRCRYDPEKPFEFSMGMNLLFAFATTFTVANLYYSHPILNKLARDFGVTDEQASYIPTLAQAGYAAGLLFLCPLGDLLRRRPFVLWLVWFTATMWIGLCITRSFAAFCAISFITSVCTVTPQLMLPLVGDLVPPHRRATALSIVVSGLILGQLFARVLAGVVTEFIGWRYIYWIAFGLQYLILILLYFFMPDYPSTNPDEKIFRRYPTLLFDILRMLTRHPVLVQSCLIGFCTATIFTSFWTTLTFLLSSPLYGYNSLVIGLFALIAIASMTWGPIFARTFMDKHEPLLSILIGSAICLVGVVVGTYTGLHTVAGPVIQAIAIDIGLQTSQVANRTAIYTVEPKGRNRVNTAYMVSVFCGQLTGTAVGNHLYAQGGWIRSGSASVGFTGAAIIIALLRGPHTKGWIGWAGGAKMRKPGLNKASLEKGAPVGSGEKDEEKGTQPYEPRTSMSPKLDESLEKDKDPHQPRESHNTNNNNNKNMTIQQADGAKILSSARSSSDRTLSPSPPEIADAAQAGAEVVVNDK